MIKDLNIFAMGLIFGITFTTIFFLTVLEKLIK